jgi:hypothetical protein
VGPTSSCRRKLDKTRAGACRSRRDLTADQPLPCDDECPGGDGPPLVNAHLENSFDLSLEFDSRFAKIPESCARRSCMYTVCIYLLSRRSMAVNTSFFAMCDSTGAGLVENELEQCSSPVHIGLQLVAHCSTARMAYQNCSCAHSMISRKGWAGLNPFVRMQSALM